MMCAIDALIGSGFAMLGLTIVMIIYKRFNAPKLVNNTKEVDANL